VHLLYLFTLGLFKHDKHRDATLTTTTHRDTGYGAPVDHHRHAGATGLAAPATAGAAGYGAGHHNKIDNTGYGAGTAERIGKCS
jgi:hypothetical protein